MAKKIAKKAAPKAAVPKVDAPEAGQVVASTTARKTVQPRAAQPAAKSAVKAAPATFSHEQIAERAYYISLTGRGGNEVDNWHLAETELRREGGAA